MEPTSGKVDPLLSIGINQSNLQDAKITSHLRGRKVVIQDTKGNVHKLPMDQFLKVVDNNVRAMVTNASFLPHGSSAQHTQATQAKKLLDTAKKLEHDSRTGLFHGNYEKEFAKIEESLPGLSSDYQKRADYLLNEIKKGQIKLKNEASTMSYEERATLTSELNERIENYNRTIKDWKETWRDEYLDLAKTEGFNPIAPIELPSRKTQQKTDQVVKENVFIKEISTEDKSSLPK